MDQVYWYNPNNDSRIQKAIIYWVFSVHIVQTWKKLRRSYKLWSGCDMIEQSHKKEVYATIDAIGHNMP